MKRPERLFEKNRYYEISHLFGSDERVTVDRYFTLFKQAVQHIRDNGGLDLRVDNCGDIWYTQMEPEGYYQMRLEQYKIWLVDNEDRERKEYERLKQKYEGGEQ